MASEWRRYEVVQLIRDAKLVIGDGYRAKNAELSAHGLPFARGGNISEGFRFDDADHFPEKNLARVGNKVSQPGDVVFTSKGTVGRFAFVLPTTPRFVYSPQLCFWRSLDQEIIDPRFLYYWMSGHEFFVQFKGVAGQTDMAEYVSLTDQRLMHITLPSPGEQRSIAHILGTLDDKIGLNKQMNKNLENIGQTIFKRWFVDFEFPNEEGKPYKSSGGEMVYNEVLDKEIPKRWETKPIDEIADFLNGLALQKFPARDGEECLPVVKIRELRQGVTESSDKANLDVPEEYVVNDGDVLFSWSGSLEVVIWGFGKGALNQHLFKVASSKYPKWFFYYWVIHYLPEYRHIAADKATTMGHIQRHHLTASQVAVPDNKTLETMDKLFAPILEKIGRIKVETRILSEIRDLTLSKLMSGKIRVPVTNENVEVQ